MIYTPNGFLHQGEVYGNPLQRHLSGWTVEEFSRMGFRVLGIEGLRPLRGEMAELRWKPRRFWLAVSLLSHLVVTTRPRLAFRLFCIKEMSK